tara:strand:- start:193 stop:459 length:267 start_codon:yes stop_codon:yes gene_type:complete
MSLTEAQKRKARNYKTNFAESITPDDRNDLEFVGSKLFIGTGGDLKVDTIAGQTITLKNIANGTLIDFIKVKKIHSRGTTASDIVAID